MVLARGPLSRILLPNRPQERSKVTFGYHFENIWGPGGHFEDRFVTVVTNLGSHSGFSVISCGGVHPQKLRGGRGTATCGVVRKQHFGLAAEGST